MKITQAKELLATIRQTRVLFISIMIVTALGVIAYCGLSFSSAAVTQMGERYYDTANFYDIKLFSAAGFNAEDIDAIEKTAGVAEVAAGYVTHKLIAVGETNIVAEFFTQPENINKPDLKEGRLPETKSECTIELPLVKRFGLQLGDTITLLSDSAPLETAEFTIVGIVELPLVLCVDDYYNRGASDIGDGQVSTLIIVGEAAFDADYFNGQPVCYVTADNQDSVFSDEYEAAAKTIRQQLETLGTERASARDKELRYEYESKIKDAQKKYQEVNDEYQAGLTAYQNSKDSLEQNQTSLLELREQLDPGGASAGIEEIDAQLDQLAEYETQLAAQKQELEAAQEQLEQAAEQIADLENQLEQLPDDKGLNKIFQAMLARQLAAAQSTYQNELAAYEAAEAEYNNQKGELAQQKEELETARAELAGTVAEVENRLQQVNYQLAEVETYEEQLAAQKEKLDKVPAQLKKIQKQIKDAEEVLKELQPISWSVTGVHSNPSFHNFTTNLNGLQSVIYTCCLLLLLISALVCYTTISRMVTEQKQLLGTQKALGFRPWEIYRKYIIYALLCTLLGIVIGVIFSYGWMENIIYEISYSAAYQAVDFIPVFRLQPVLIIALGELSCTILAAYLACRQLVKQDAVTLMKNSMSGQKNSQQKAKGFGQGSAAASSCEQKDASRAARHISLNLKMALRNVLANKKILVTTMVGVIGCTVLLIVVFTVRYGMAGVTARQYTELQHYDGTLVLNSEASDKEQAQLRDFVENEAAVKQLPICEKYTSFKAGDEYHYATLIASTDAELASFITLQDAFTGAELSIPQDGLLISKKLAEEYGFTVGDEFIITDSQGNDCAARISGIFERNIGNALVIAPEYYAAVTQEELSFEQYYIQLTGCDRQTFIEQLKQYSAYVSYNPADVYIAEFNYKITCVDQAVLVILVLAFLLAVFVLFNLSIMNITQKEKEIVVMKVMGFATGHIQRYVLRETTIMSCLGLLLGVAAGAPLGAFITKAIELEGIQNIRGLNLQACLIGAGICLVFFTAANLIALIKINKIKMTGTSRQE